MSKGTDTNMSSSLILVVRFFFAGAASAFSMSSFFAFFMRSLDALVLYLFFLSFSI